MPPELITSNVRDALAVGLKILESANEELAWLVPSSVFTLAMSHGFADKTSAFIQNGGVVRGIVEVSAANIKDVRICLECGQDVRHSEDFGGVFMLVADGRESISAINTGVANLTLDTATTALWSENPSYAQYLLTVFAQIWVEAVPATERLPARQG